MLSKTVLPPVQLTTTTETCFSERTEDDEMYAVGLRTAVRTQGPTV
jgi:hypothetical protein